MDFSIEKIKLHPAQLEIYYEQMMDTTSPHYNVGGYVDFRGKLDTEKLSCAIQDMYEAFDIHRLCFDFTSKVPSCYFLKKHNGLPAKRIDFSQKGQPEQEAQEWIKQRFNLAFQLDGSLLFETAILKISDEHYKFFLRYHHIITDGSGFKIVIDYISTRYSNLVKGIQLQNNNRPPYEEDIKKATAYRESERYQKDIKYWINQFDSMPEPVLFKRYKNQWEKEKSSSNVYIISNQRRNRFRKLSKALGTSLHQLMLMALHVYFGRVNKAKDLVFGSIANNRRKHQWSTFGLYSGVLPFRTHYNGSVTVKDLQKEIRSQLLKDYRHQRPTISSINKALDIRKFGRSVLFEIVVNHLFLDFEADFYGLEYEAFEVENSYESIPLNIVWRDFGMKQNLQLRIDFHKAYFKFKDIDYFIENLLHIIDQFSVNTNQILDEIDIISPKEKKLLQQFNNRQIDLPLNETVVSQFEKQVLINPDSTALINGSVTLTYQQLNQVVNQLSNYLIEKYDIKAEDAIIIALNKSEWTFITILAILKAGGAYIPIDIRNNQSFTKERTDYISSNDRVKIIFDRQELDRFLDIKNQYDTTNPNIFINRNQLAYIIYTSGSTGKPKGVMVEHGNLIDTAYGWKHDYQLDDNTTLLQIANIAFDVCTGDMCRSLLFGGKMIVCPPVLEAGIKGIHDLLVKHQISILESTPSLIIPILEYAYQEGTDLSFMDLIIVGSDVCSVNDFNNLADWFGKNVRIINSYGTTETTIDSCFYEKNNTDTLPHNYRIPIGRPMPNVKLHILDQKGRRLPIGAIGELCIEGVGVARGYMGMDSLTEKVFTKNPFLDNNRIYKTGDIARWQLDGNIELLGRVDNQVKLRGYRIELGEIEWALEESDDVYRGIAFLRESKNKDKFLIAYVIPAKEYNQEKLQTHLKMRLPDYMIPAHIIQLEKFPITPNGKVDKNALPMPDVSLMPSCQYIAPRNELEKDLGRIWKKILKVDKIGVEDNFFELGGDSINIIQIAGKARLLGYDIKPKTIFSHQTVATLAKALKSSIKTVKAEQGQLTGICPLSTNQQSFFEKQLERFNNNHQSILFDIDKSINEEQLEETVALLVQQHDVLGFEYYEENNKWQQKYTSKSYNVENKDFTNKKDYELLINEFKNTCQQKINFSNNYLIHFCFIKTPTCDTKNRLLILTHPLLVDHTSWQLIINHFESSFNDLQKGKKVQLNPKTSAYRDWVNALNNKGIDHNDEEQLAYWKAIPNSIQPLPAILPENIVKSVTIQLDKKLTKSLLNEANITYRTKVTDILLAALVQTIQEWSKQEQIVIGLEGSGRMNQFKEIDLSNTLGRFSYGYPALFKVNVNTSSDLIKTIKEQLRVVPKNGLDYEWFRYFHPAQSIRALLSNQEWNLTFSFVNQDNFSTQNNYLKCREVDFYEKQSLTSKLDIKCSINKDQLAIVWKYASQYYETSVMDQLIHNYQNNLKQLINHCLTKETVEWTPSDYGLPSIISYHELDQFLDAKNEPSDKINRRAAISALYPLSPLQEGMLFHGLYENNAESYVEQCVFEFLEGFDSNTFQIAWNYILQKHTALRSSFVVNQFNIPLQCIYKNSKIVIRELDYTTMLPHEQKEAFETLKSEDRKKGVNFSETSLIRIILVKEGVTRYRMLMTFHHILLDGWSMSIVMNEFINAYDCIAQGKKINEIEIDHYEDFIRYLSKQDPLASESFWKSYIKGFDRPSLLPFIKQTKERNKGGDTKETILLLDKAKTEKIKAFAKTTNVTINTLFQGVWSFLLAKYTGEEQALFGVTVSGRPTALKDAEKRVGLYINTIPLCVKVQESQTIETWLTDVQQGHVDAREYQHTSLSHIQQWSEIKGDLFDSILVFENYPMKELENISKGQLKLGEIQLIEETNYLLTITVDCREEILVQFTYNGTLLDSAFVAMIKGHFENVFDQLIDKKTTKISDIHLLQKSEVDTLLYDFNGTKTSYPKNATILDLITEQTINKPEAIAVSYGGEQLTYKELNKHSNQLAHYLKRKGVNGNELIPICLDRSIEMIVGLLGIIKSGAAYVPIDFEYPQNRIDYILKDINARWVLTKSSYRSLFNSTGNFQTICLDEERIAINQEISDSLALSPRGHDPIYVLYTSGSTGKPKGVMISHLNLYSCLLTEKALLKLNSKTKTCLLTNFVFDVSLLELFLPLITGGTLVIPNKTALEQPSVLLDLLSSEGVTLLQGTPSYINYFINNISQSDTTNLKLKTICLGGESLNGKLVNKIRNKLKGVQINNHYGPTEATIDAIVLENIKDFDSNIIGKPIANTHVYIMDANNQLVPIGVQGEICLGGDGISLGYLNNPELTNEKFINSPFNTGRKLYKTGDLGKWTLDGNIEFIGRKDDQVKLRGFRIELGEIETVLHHCEDVKQCIVLLKEDKNKNKFLVGYVISESGSFNKDSSIAYMKQRLPAYMIPSILIEIESFPLTYSGKINQKALPDPMDVFASQYVAPRNEIEERLVKIWENLLDKKPIGVNDDFFNIGGHSLLATRLMSSIQKEFAINIPLKTIFEYTTIAELYYYLVSTNIIEEEETEEEFGIMEI